MKEEKPKRVTNAQFAQKDKPFVDACQKVSQRIGKKFLPTRRQASKWRRKMGRAYKTVNKIEIV